MKTLRNEDTGLQKEENYHIFGIILAYFFAISDLTKNLMSTEFYIISQTMFKKYLPLLKQLSRNLFRLFKLYLCLGNVFRHKCVFAGNG